MNERINILGIDIDNVTEDEALERIQGFIESGRPHQVVTVNPEFLVQSRSNDDFRHALLDADLSLPDGAGLLWASRFLGRPLKARVTGTDLVRHLAGIASKRHYRIFLLGAAQGIGAKTAGILKQECPGLDICGVYGGSPRQQEEDYIVDIVMKASPHLLFVAYGAPQQDLWIQRNLSRLGVPVAVGVGGAFDFISGRVKRAPLRMRRYGLEWLYRLSQEPWRWRRMLRLPLFVCLVVRSKQWNQ